MDTVSRYAALDLFVAREHHEVMQNFVSRSDKDGRRPFARQVDVWWAAICIGVRLGYRTKLGDRDSRVKFNTGAILNSDPWRVAHMELVALAQGGEAVLEHPYEVIEIANEYAATGLAWLTERLLGESVPTLTLMNQIDEMLVASTDL